MNDFIAVGSAIGVAVIGLAIVSVIVSKNAQTPQVLQAGGSALASLINAAVSPVTQGGSSQSGFNLPNGMFG